MSIVLNFLFYFKHREFYIVSQWNLLFGSSPLKRHGVGFHLEGFEMGIKSLPKGVLLFSLLLKSTSLLLIYVIHYVTVI